MKYVNRCKSMHLRLNDKTCQEIVEQMWDSTTFLGRPQRFREARKLAEVGAKYHVRFLGPMAAEFIINLRESVPVFPRTAQPNHDVVERAQSTEHDEDVVQGAQHDEDVVQGAQHNEDVVEATEHDEDIVHGAEHNEDVEHNERRRIKHRDIKRQFALKLAESKAKRTSLQSNVPRLETYTCEPSRGILRARVNLRDFDSWEILRAGEIFRDLDSWGNLDLERFSLATNGA